MEGLIVEVSDLSRRNDELMTSKDSDLVVIRELDAQLKEYKRKYEQAKTELRSVKGISHTLLSHLALFSHSNQQPRLHCSYRNRNSTTSYRFPQTARFLTCISPHF